MASETVELGENVSGINQFMAIVLGVILFAFLLAGIMVIVRNLKKRMLPGQENKTPLPLKEASGEENRLNERVGLILPVSIETSNGPLEAETRDISLSGAFIACNKPLPLKELFSLSINIPGQEILHLNSEVVWSNASVSETSVITRGMGVRFLGMTNQDRRILNKAITSFIEEGNMPKSV